MATEWVNVSTSAFYGDYSGYIRFANQVLSITGTASSSTTNGMRIFNISPNTHYRVTMVMQNRFRLGCLANLTNGQTVTNYVFDPLDANDGTCQNTSRTLEITSGANQVYLCVGAWSSGAPVSLADTLATIVLEEEQEVSVEQHTVTFADHNGTVLKTENVNDGGSATPPADPVREGYTFTGWSGSYTNVTADMTITAQYTRQQYTVTFTSYSGTVYKTETVNAGEDATPPDDPVLSGYVFTGWNGDYTDVTANVTVYAQFRVYVTCTVTFKDFDGTVLKTETIERYHDATAPEDPTRPGYVFSGWYGEYQNVSMNSIVTAQYTMYIYRVRFYDDDGTLLKQMSAQYGYNATDSCWIDARIGSVFTGWSVPVNSIQDDVDTVAQYATVPAYTVTFTEYDGTVLGTQQVNAGDHAYRSHKSTRAGYKFVGWGETATGSSIYNVQSDMTVAARYASSGYTVNVIFYDNDSTTVLQDTWVPVGGSATPPTPPEHEGLIFYAWSTSSYINVEYYGYSSPVNVYARYGAAINTVTYYNGNTVLKTEQVPFGGNATPPTETPVLDEDHVFSYWTDDGQNVHADRDIYARFDSIPTRYIVFRNYDKLYIQSVYVKEGQTATPPADPVRDGYTFLGWDGDNLDVQNTTILTAHFAGTAYTVTFLDYNGDVLKTEVVEEGTNATPPANPVRLGYEFSGWSGSYTNVLDDQTVTATYQAILFTVRFVDYNAAVLKTETVVYGADATPPADPARTGYVFTGWDGSYTAVTADTTVTAQYRLIVIYTVRFLSYTSRVISTQLIVEGEAATPPIAPLRPGYTLTGWSADTSNVTSNMDVSAVYTRNNDPLVLEVLSGNTPVLNIKKVTAATLRDSLEGELTLSFSTLSRLAANIQTGQTVRLRDLYFSIVRVQKSISQGMWLTTVTCEHISYVLNDDDYKITELDFTGSPSNALAQVLDGTPLNVGVVEYSGNVTLQINQECTRRAALMQLIALLGGEIEYDGYDINIRTHRGSQTAKQLMESRNVTNVGVTHDSRSATASHSNDKYRRVILRCNMKFENETKCTTPTLDEDTLKERFVAMFNTLITDRATLLNDMRLIQTELTDTTEIDRQIADASQELTIITEMMRKAIEQNARTCQSQEEYMEEFNALKRKFEAEKKKVESLQKNRADRAAKADAMGGFIFTLSERTGIIAEFDDKLWLATVDHVTAHHDGRLVFRLTTGMEIEG